MTSSKAAVKPTRATGRLGVLLRFLVCASVLLVAPPVLLATMLLLPLSLAAAAVDVRGLALALWVLGGIAGLIGLARARLLGARTSRRSVLGTELMIAAGIAAAIPPATAAGFALLALGRQAAFASVAAVYLLAFAVLIAAGGASMWRLHRLIPPARARDPLPRLFLTMSLLLALTVLVVSAGL